MTNPINQSDQQFDTVRSVSIFGWFLRLPWKGWGLLLLGLGFFSMALSQISHLLYGAESSVLRAATGLFVLLMLPCFGLALVARLARFSVQSTSQKRLSLWGCGLSVVGLSVFMLITMIPAIMRARQTAGDSQWTARRFAGDTFEIHVPASWTADRAMETQPGELYLTGAHHDLHLMASAVPKTDLTAATLPEVRDLQIQQLTRALTDPDVTSFDVETFGSARGTDTVVTGSVDSIRLWYLVRHLDYGAYWVEVRVWTTPSRLEQHQDVLQRILDSVGPAR